MESLTLFALVACVPALLTACADESTIAQRTPVNAQLFEHAGMKNPSILGSYPQIAEPSNAYAPLPRPARRCRSGSSATTRSDATGRPLFELPLGRALSLATGKDTCGLVPLPFGPYSSSPYPYAPVYP